MSNKPDSILLDLDGTLIDTAPDFHWVINQLLIEEQLPEISMEFLRHYVSAGARAMVCAAFACTEDHPDYPRRHKRMLEIYQSHLAVKSQLFPGMDNFLLWLEAQQIPWGVVTNKPSLYTFPVMEGLKLDKRCAVTICPDHVTHRKPHPEALLLACNKLQCNHKNSIYIGDHQRDIEAGKNAQMKTIAVGYGYLQQHESHLDWQADYNIDNATELKPLLQSLYDAL